MTGRGDVERVRRTVEEMVALVAGREARFQELALDSPQVMRARRASGELDDMADVFLVIDNWSGLRQELPDLEDPIRDVIAARGPGYGVHLVMSANRWTEVRDALRNAIGGRLELRLTEPTESVVDIRAARSLSESAGQYEKRVEELRQLTGDSPRFEKLFGRGITTGGLQFQAALPRVDGAPDILDLQAGTERLVRAIAVAWGGPAAPPIRVLPPSIRLDELPSPVGEPAGVPVGISEQDLDTVFLDLVEGDPHFVVFGDVESGKTTFLRTFLPGTAAASPAWCPRTSSWPTAAPSRRPARTSRWWLSRSAGGCPAPTCRPTGCAAGAGGGARRRCTWWWTTTTWCRRRPAARSSPCTVCCPNRATWRCTW